MLLVLLVSVLSMAPTCGKRRPPLAPIERVPQRTEALTGAQRGNQVILSWPAPRRNANEGSVQSIRRVDVYRVAERPNAPLALTEEEFATRATLIGSVTYDEIKQAGESLSYIDTLELIEPARLRYAVRYVNSAGQSAAFSNFFLMEPAAKVAGPPVIFATGNEYSETSNTITWEAPKTNTDGSTPVNLLGYNIYRTNAGLPRPGQTPLNQQPLTATQYQDKKFSFGEQYVYVVRAVSLGTEGKPVESVNSNSFPLTPIDKYPPAAPQNLSVGGPAPGRFSIFWLANSEPDLAGYYLYRSTDPNLAKEKWTRLTPTLYPKTTYADETVEAGKTYYYYVVAVDKAGNVSPFSEVASETAP